MNESSFRCPSCDQGRTAAEWVDGALLPESVVRAIQQWRPSWSRRDPICSTCANKGKANHMQALLEEKMGRLSPLEEEVIASIRDRGFVSAKLEEKMERRLTQPERLADVISRVIGSWRFSAAVLLAIAAWVVVNVLYQPFEPYPVVIMAVISAVLASLAAIEGPFIMMSQRRRQKEDRLRAEEDYQVNLKAELELRYLEEKLDHWMAMQKRDLESEG